MCFVLFVFWTTQAVHIRVGSGKVAEVRVALGRRGGTDHVTCTRLQGHMSKPNSTWFNLSVRDSLVNQAGRIGREALPHGLVAV